MANYLKTNKFPGKISLQTLLFFFHNFFINVGTTLVYVSANILLLENHPEYSLPIAYVLSALAVMLAGKVYEYFEHHLLLEKLSMGTMIASLFMVLVVMGLLWQGHGVATAIAIMVGYRIIYLLINLEFWGLSAVVFDVRQSKRLFSVIGSGDMPAKALGAVLAVVIHTPSVLMILLLISLVFFALAFYTQKLTFLRTDVPDPHHGATRNSAPPRSNIIQKYFGGNGLVTALCLGMVFIAAAATWIEYHFFVNVKYKFHSQHDVIIFIGSLLTATYLISTVIKLLFSGKTVEKFGVGFTLYLLPATSIVTSLGLIVSSYFRKDEPSLLVYYCLAYILFEMVRRTIFDPVFLVLFQPLSTKNRLKGHTLAKGLFEPLGMLLSGLILWIVYTMQWSNLSLTFDLSLLFALAALIIFRKAYAQYVLELKSAISKRFLRSGEMAAPGEALPIIIENLKSDKKEEIINAIDWLARNKESLLIKNAAALLQSPFVPVRYKTLETLKALKKNFLPESFIQYIETEPDSGCQTLAVRMACANSLLSEEKIAGYLVHDDTDIVCGTIIGCWESNKHLPLIHGTLQKLFNSEKEQLQIVALQCVRYTGIGVYEKYVTNSLSNNSLVVRQRAVDVIADSGNAQLLNLTIPLLTGPQSKQVINALIRTGNPGISIIEKWIHTQAGVRELHHFCREAEKNPRARLHNILLKLTESIYSNQHLIHFKNTDINNTFIRQSVLKALIRFPQSAEKEHFVNGCIEAELAHATQLLHGMYELSAIQSLADALHYELKSTTERLFNLFMLPYDQDSIQNARKGITHGSNERRANSLEMIESLLPRTLHPALRALFEHADLNARYETLSQYLGNTHKVIPILDYILIHRDKYFTAWTIALAIQYTGPSIQDSEDISLFLTHPATIIRQTTHIQISASQPISHGIMKHSEMTQKISEMEKVIVLKNTQLFSQTPENVLSSIAPIMKEVTYSEGQQIFGKGDVGDSMYIIYSGEVGIYDDKKRLALFDKGEIFGELALMDTEPRSATASAETDLLLFRMDQEDFYELMEERDEILKNVLRILCQRIRVQNEKMSILMTA